MFLLRNRRFMKNDLHWPLNDCCSSAPPETNKFTPMFHCDIKLFKTNSLETSNLQTKHLLFDLVGTRYGEYFWCFPAQAQASLKSILPATG